MQRTANKSSYPKLLTETDVVIEDCCHPKPSRNVIKWNDDGENGSLGYISNIIQFPCGASAPVS